MKLPIDFLHKKNILNSEVSSTSVASNPVPCGSIKGRKNMKAKVNKLYPGCPGVYSYEQGKYWMVWYTHRGHVDVVRTNLPYKKTKGMWNFYQKAIKSLVNEL